jgi:signal transduction histidine kinase/CheY-like chemotaxis protein
MGYEPKPSATGIAAAEAWPALIARVAPEDRDKAQGMIEKIGGGGPDGEIECRVVGDDGVERVIEARWKQEASGKDDKKKSVFATFSDVTERVKAREALSAAKAKADDVLASIGDGFCAIDARGVFTYFNAVAERMLARNGADMIGQHYLDLVPEYRGTVADRMIRTALAERLPMDFEDVSPARKTWTFYSLHPTGDGGLSILFRDISKQKATQDELVSSKHELERANKAKSRFIASASHDLRQPVQSLLLLLTMVERQVAEMPKTLSMVKLMQLALGGLNGLLTSILDISRLDAGVVEAANENVDLGALLGRLSSEYATKAAAHGLELRYVPRSVVVAADPTLLERALRNLVENALRYTPKGKVLIGVRRRGGQARIDVVDTGVGIPPERRSDIFEEFVQIDNPGRDPGKGMGLGLAVVERLATLVGARVEVDSNFGRGSRFSLSLPVVESVRKPPQALPAAVGNPGERILVVEDNFILRLTFEDMLRDWGYETISSGTGEAALEQAEHEGWNLSAIVTDHRLGAGMTGVQTAQEIRRRSGKAIPTLVVTGDTAKERIAEINASGFDLLHKPIGADELRRHVAAMVESGCGSDGKSFRLAAIGRMMTPKPKPEAMAAGK